VPVNETEFDAVKDRLTRTESTLSQVVDSVGQVAATQQQQQAALGSLSSDMQSLLTLMKTKDGRLDIRLLMAVIGGLAAVIVPLGAMFLAPLKTQVDNLQLQMIRDLGNTRTDIDVLRKDGAPVIRERLAVDEERARITAAQIAELQDRERARLEAEAAAGRRFLYGGTPAPHVPAPKDTP